MIDDIDVREFREAVWGRLLKSPELRETSVAIWLNRLSSETLHLVESAQQEISIRDNRPCLLLIYFGCPEILNNDRLPNLQEAAKAIWRLCGVDQIVISGTRCRLVIKAGDRWIIQGVEV